MYSTALIPIIYSRRWPLIARGATLVFLAAFLASVWLVARLYSGFESRIVAFVVAFITVQAMILVLLTAGLMLMKLVALRRERAQRMHREILEGLMADALLLGRNRDLLIERSRCYPDQARQVFSSAFRSLRGEVRNDAERLFLESGLFAEVLPDVVSRDPNRALSAVALVRELDRKDARKAMEGALLHPLPIVQLAARVAIMKNGDPAARRRVLQNAGGLPFWQRLALFYFVPNDSRIVDEFVAESLASDDDERVLGALEFLLTREKGFPLLSGLPARLEESKNVEVRIKLFKALPLVCERREAAPLLRRGLADGDWRVRSMAARASGVLKARETRSRLFELVAAPASTAEMAHAARAVVAVSEDLPADLERLVTACAKEHRAALDEVLGRVRR